MSIRMRHRDSERILTFLGTYQVEAVQVWIRVGDATCVGSPPRGTTETGHLERLIR